MSTTINTGWLKDKNGDKFAPKTLTSQVINGEGVSVEQLLANVAIETDDTLTVEGAAADAKAVGDALAERDTFVVTVSIDETNSEPTSDKTLNEIADAKEAGKVCVARFVIVIEGQFLFEEYYYLRYCNRGYFADFAGSPLHQHSSITINEGTNVVDISPYEIPKAFTAQFASGFQYLALVDSMAASQNGQSPEYCVLRNSSLSATDQTPSYNGEICWTYK